MISIPRAALALQRFTRDDRVDLSCVAMEADPAGSIAVATDGHRLAWVRWDVHFGDMPQQLIPAAACLAALAVPSPDWPADPFYPDMTDLEKRMGYRLMPNCIDARDRVKISYDPGTRFPPWRKVIPPTRDPTDTAAAVIGWDLEYLAEFRDFTAGVGDSIVHVWAHLPEDPHGPIRWQSQLTDPWCGDLEVGYCVMPVRL